MANNVADDINFYLSVDKSQLDHLAAIRHWSNLKLAFDEDTVWIKDLDYAQVNTPEVKSIPHKSTYSAKEGKLYLVNSRLPDRNIPSLLWTPIERALYVQLPSFNHNYFGISDKVNIHIVESGEERAVNSMITSVQELRTYIETAPEIRLGNIQWTILNNDKVFLTGTPLLPLNGEVYWQRDNFIIPAGYDIDLYILSAYINDMINPGGQSLIIWDTDATYFIINQTDLQPLSRSSFRKSLQQYSLV